MFIIQVKNYIIHYNQLLNLFKKLEQINYILNSWKTTLIYKMLFNLHLTPQLLIKV